MFVVAGLDGHELHVDAVAIEHLEVAQLGSVGIDEDEVVDHGLEAVDDLLPYPLCDFLHRQKVFDTFFIERVAYEELATVGDVHGKPGGFLRPSGSKRAELERRLEI